MCDRRHPHAAYAHRRRAARRARDSPAPPGHRRARAVPVRRGRVRARPALRERRGVGYLLKDRVSDIAELRGGRPPRGRGRTPLSTRPSSPSSSAAAARTTTLGDLTPREREVLELMAEGRSNQAVCDRMCITQRAVEKHVTSIFTKLRLPPTPATTGACSRLLAFLRRLTAPARTVPARSRRRLVGNEPNVPPGVETANPRGG